MRRLFGAAALAAVALTVVLIGSASAKSPQPTQNCPSTLNSFQATDLAGAFFTSSGNTSTYYVNSPTDDGASLVGYCVYTNGVLTATTVSVDNWKTDFNGGNASFARAGGTKTNLPLDGSGITEIGTGTFDATPPTSQNILLHITDPTVCSTFYGVGTTTCYVLPKPGPVCNAGTGNADAAYNAIPFDVEHCSPPSYAFEGNFANEFGDEVTLDTTGGDGSGGVTLRVDFQSYGCGDAGHWYDPQCATTSGETFTVPGGITAKLYDGSLNLIATSTTINPNIPFRPSAIPDAGNCPNPPPSGYPADSRFKDPVSGQCNYSLSVPLTFTFPNTTFASGQDVVWTVQFNTSHGGYAPIVTNLPPEGCIVLAQGCGYDSLNVGTKTYAPDAFAGTDVSEDTVLVSTGNPDFASPLVPLAPETGWTGYRPLGEIVLQ